MIKNQSGPIKKNWENEQQQLQCCWRDGAILLIGCAFFSSSSNNFSRLPAIYHLAPCPNIRSNSPKRKFFTHQEPANGSGETNGSGTRNTSDIRRPMPSTTKQSQNFSTFFLKRIYSFFF